MTARIPLASALAAFPAVAGAGILSVIGAVQHLPAPADARPDAFTSLTYIRAWDERQQVTLDERLRVDGVNSGLYDGDDDLGVHFISAGTVVSSHFVHFDTPETQLGTASGAVTFTSDILGVIVLGDSEIDPANSLDASDFLGLPSTIYPDALYRRGVEMFNDRFSISADRRSLTLGALYVMAPGDSIRVITAAVPAPGALAALGALAVARRRTRPVGR